MLNDTASVATDNSLLREFNINISIAMQKIVINLIKNTIPNN